MNKKKKSSKKKIQYEGTKREYRDLLKHMDSFRDKNEKTLNR